MLKNLSAIRSERSDSKIEGGELNRSGQKPFAHKTWKAFRVCKRFYKERKEFLGVVTAEGAGMRLCQSLW